MQTKVFLPESELPTHWYNVLADMPNKPAPYLVPDGNPVTPDAMMRIFPEALVMQEMTAERWVEIPEPGREALRGWRASPRYRAHRLEKEPLLAAFVAFQAAAQVANWPRQRPITFVVPTPAGGSNDATGRAVGEVLGKQLGQTIIVDNRPGASGSIAMDFVSKAAPDGYTFVVASDSVFLQPVLRKNVRWSVERDFVPVIMFGTQPIVVATYAASPYKSIKDLVAAAKAKPGSIGYATSGQGSIQHLAGELLGEMAGIDLLHIPYKGGGQAISDLVGGQVPVAVLGMAAPRQRRRAVRCARRSRAH